MIFKQHNSKNLQKEVKAFFHGITWKKTLTFLFFLLLAFGFWLLQVLQEPVEKEMFVTIHYKNIPQGVVLDNNVPTEIKIKIRDKGTSHLRYTVGKKENKFLEIDLENIDLKKSLYTISSKEMDSWISNYLSATTTLISFSPDILNIGYRPLEKKELPIELTGRLVPASGYILIDTALFTPAKVFAYGQKSALDSLSAIYTENIVIEKIKSSVKKQIKLVVPKGISLEKNKVELNVSAAEFTEKVIQIPIVCTNLPENYKIHIFPSFVEIICPVTLADYNRIDVIDFEVTVDYFELLKSSNYTTNVSLSGKPEWIKNYRINPEKVEFLIEQKSAL